MKRRSDVVYEASEFISTRSDLHIPQIITFHNRKETIFLSKSFFLTNAKEFANNLLI
jgi:hypothetical protein